MKNIILLKIAGGIMVLIGLVNLLKGIRVFSDTELPDSPLAASLTEIKIAGAATIIIAALMIVTGVLLFSGKSVWMLSVLAIIAFVAVSVFNYSLIEGEALATGSVIDMSFGLILLIIIYLGKKKEPGFTGTKIETKSSA